MKEVTAEIITIGDEILYGQTIDTNSAFMGEKLGKLGVLIKKITSISDTKEAILDAISQTKAHIVLITGGLGPTLDDITKETLCTFFNDKLELNNLAWQYVKEFYESRNRTISEVNKMQAFLPTKCTCLPNKIGTASGMWFENNNQIYVSMPGVPREMKMLINHEVIPKLKTKFKFPIIKHRFINTVGIAESNLAAKINRWELQLPHEIALAYLPSLGRVKLRLTAKGDNENNIENLLDLEIKKVEALINEYIYAYEDFTFEEAISQLLTDKNYTISTAESCTGGNIAKLLTSVSGSSNYFIGGIISYSNEVKINQLNVSSETLQKYGAVSQETAIEMVKGVNNKFKTDISIATTGIAGPDGRTEEKPVGTVWIALLFKGKITTKLIHVGDLGRENNIESASIYALNLMRKII